jgi:hypothetical protein
MLTGFQLVKKFPKFYATRRFTTAFTSSRHLSLSWASSIQSIPPHPTSWRSIIILFAHLRLGLPSGLFPSGFPTKTLYSPFLCRIRATWPTHFHKPGKPVRFWKSNYYRIRSLRHQHTRLLLPMNFAEGNMLRSQDTGLLRDTKFPSVLAAARQLIPITVTADRLLLQFTRNTNPT